MGFRAFAEGGAVDRGDRSAGEDAIGINTAESPGRALLGRDPCLLAPNQPVDSRSVSQVNVVYSLNGATVLRRAAGLVSNTVISGDPEGVHTVETTVRGLSGLLRTADGSFSWARATSSCTRSSAAR